MPTMWTLLAPHSDESQYFITMCQFYTWKAAHANEMLFIITVHVETSMHNLSHVARSQFACDCAFFFGKHATHTSIKKNLA